MSHELADALCAALAALDRVASLPCTPQTAHPEAREVDATLNNIVRVTNDIHVTLPQGVPRPGAPPWGGDWGWGGEPAPPGGPEKLSPQLLVPGLVSPVVLDTWAPPVLPRAPPSQQNTPPLQGLPPPKNTPPPDDAAVCIRRRNQYDAFARELRALNDRLTLLRAGQPK